MSALLTYNFSIFQRVQLGELFIYYLIWLILDALAGMTLTPAEKLQAISSPLAQWVAHLQAMYVNANGGLIDHIQWDISRGVVICSWQVK